MRLKLPLKTSAKDLRLVPADHRDILAATPNWEVVGVVVFDGQVYFLVFVERKYFYQVSHEVFESSSLEIPAGWRMVAGVADRLPGVTILLAHPLIASNPNLASLLVDMNADAMTTLRAALEQGEA
jgi:hypothetical protein